MHNLTFREKVSAALRGAMIPFLPVSGSGSSANYNIVSALFGKNDPTPIKSAEDAYARYLGWVMAAVSMIAFDVRTQPFTVWDRKGNTDREEWEVIPVTEYPAAMTRPNMKLTFQDLIEITQMSLDLTGEGFWHLVRNSEGAKLDGVQFLYTEWVNRYNPSENGTRIQSWRIMAEGGSQTIPDDDIIQFKYPNPNDPVRGMSPLSGVGTSADLDTYSRNYVSGFFRNGGVPPVVIKTTAAKLTGEQRDQVVETFMDRYAQGENQPGVLAKDGDIKVIGYPLKDLDIEMLSRLTREQIFAIYGIPPAKFGIKDAGGLSDDNKSYEYSYQMNCKRPRLLRLQEEVNLSAVPLWFPDRDVFFEYQNPVDEDVKLKKEIANEMLEHGAITINQYLGMMGQPETAQNDGDVYLIPTDAVRVPAGELNLIPEIQTMAARLEEANQKGLKLTQITGTYRMQLAQLEFLRAQDAQERSFKSKIRGLFSREQKMVLAAYDAEFGKKDFDPNGAKASLKFSGPYIEDGKLMPGEFIKAYEFTGGILEQTNVDAWTAEEVTAVRLGLESGVDLVADEIGEAAVISTTQMSVKVNAIAGERVGLVLNESYKVVNEIVDQGLKTGASTNEIRDAILHKYDTWKGYRAEAVARTETANAVNTGKQWGAETMAKEYDLKPKKQWVSTIDGATRDSHLSANKQTRELSEPFTVGGAQLMNPGQYGGPPAETINCRCTVVYSVLDK